MADFKKDAADRAVKLRKDVDEHSRDLYVGGHKGDTKAFDHVQNIRESEAEDQEVRAKGGKNSGEIGVPWNFRFSKSKE